MNLLSFKKISAVYIFLFSFFFSSQLLAATTTFSFTGSNQTFTVPAGVTSITMEGFGAAGGAGENCPATGGKGGYLKSTITVTANDTLTIVGGGDTAAALELFDLSKFMTHVSTGGGASLQLLSGESLIAIQSLEI